MKFIQKHRSACIVLIILLGIGLFVYPIISNYNFAQVASEGTQEFDTLMEQIPSEELEYAWREAVSYNESLEGNPVKDPFLKGSGTVMAENYAQVLNLRGAGAMGYITIPKIGVRLTVYHSTSEDVLQKGVGHLEGSSLPIGGIDAHSVLTGHAGLAHAKMFTDLPKLEKGDTFYLHILDQTLAYKVDQIKVVLPEDVSDLRREAGQDYCTLITCTPLGLNTHRLLVRGARTEYVPEIEEQQIRESNPSAQWFTPANMLIGLGLGLVAAIVIILILVRRRKKLRERKRYWWDEIDLPAKGEMGWWSPR